MDAQSIPNPFLNEVYAYIELGTRNGMPDILSTSSSLRVKDYFVANDGFEVPIGVSLYVDNCDCEP